MRHTARAGYGLASALSVVGIAICVRHRHAAGLVLAGLGAIGAAVALAVTSWRVGRALVPFRQAVETAGADMERAVDAVAELQKLFSWLGWVLRALALAAVVATLATLTS
jgi:hypothetical protein